MQKETSAKARIQKWDILKFFLIFLVVLGHFLEIYKPGQRNLQILRYWIYTFHMPMFVFVTGLFSKKNIDEKRYSKISVYLMTYFVCDFLIAVVNMFITGELKYSVTVVTSIPWYGFAMFAYCFITIGIMKMKLPKPYVFVLSVVLSCFAGYDSSVGRVFALDRLIVFFPFFFAGYCFEPRKLAAALSKLPVKIFSAVYIAAYTLIIYFKFDKLLRFQPLFTAHAYSKIKDAEKFLGVPPYLVRLGVRFLLLSDFARARQTEQKGNYRKARHTHASGVYSAFPAAQNYNNSV